MNGVSCARQPTSRARHHRRFFPPAATASSSPSAPPAFSSSSLSNSYAASARELPMSWHQFANCFIANPGSAATHSCFATVSNAPRLNVLGHAPPTDPIPIHDGMLGRFMDTDFPTIGRIDFGIPRTPPDAARRRRRRVNREIQNLARHATHAHERAVAVIQPQQEIPRVRDVFVRLLPPRPQRRRVDVHPMRRDVQHHETDARVKERRDLRGDDHEQPRRAQGRSIRANVGVEFIGVRWS